MGYDKDTVFDLAEHTEQERPLDRLMTQLTRVMEADQWFVKAQGYALGRMWTEAAPLEDEDGRDDEQGSAIQFALLYQQMLADFADRKRPAVRTLPEAWQDFAASLGGTIEP